MHSWQVNQNIRHLKHLDISKPPSITNPKTVTRTHIHTHVHPLSQATSTSHTPLSGSMDSSVSVPSCWRCWCSRLMRVCHCPCKPTEHILTRKPLSRVHTCTSCRLRWRGDLVQGRLGDPPLGRSGHQHADTNVVDDKWRLLINNTALYSLGLQHHFRLLTSRVKCYWLLGQGRDTTFPYSATSSDCQALTTHTCSTWEDSDSQLGPA